MTRKYIIVPTVFQDGESNSISSQNNGFWLPGFDGVRLLTDTTYIPPTLSTNEIVDNTVLHMIEAESSHRRSLYENPPIPVLRGNKWQLEIESRARKKEADILHKTLENRFDTKGGKFNKFLTPGDYESLDTVLQLPGKIIGGTAGLTAGTFLGGWSGAIAGGVEGGVPGAIVGFYVGVRAGAVGGAIIGAKYGGQASKWALDPIAHRSAAIAPYTYHIINEEFVSLKEYKEITGIDINQRLDDVYRKDFARGQEVANKINDIKESIKKGNILLHVDPIIIDLDYNGINLVGLTNSTVLFDMDMDGVVERTAWIDNGDGILVMDKNGDGQINDLSEILSEEFDLSSRTAMEALKNLDVNGDGIISSLDQTFFDIQIWGDANKNDIVEKGELREAQFSDIKIWQDGNSNGLVDSDELKTLEEHGITEIDLDSQLIGESDNNGNIIESETTASGKLVKEVSLLVDTTNFISDRRDDGVNYYRGEDGSIMATGDGIVSASGKIDFLITGNNDDNITITSDEGVIVQSSKGNDIITAGVGNDVVNAGQGQDTLNGGSGLDTAIYSGNKSNFTITNNSGTWTVTDNRSDANINLGTDTLTNIERIRFDDEVIHTDNTNNNPIVVGGEMTTRGNQPLTITTEELLNTATDIDGDYLTLSQIGNPIGGSASMDQSGNVIFTPQENFTGKASFDYKVDDGHGGTATGTAEINILPDLPTDQWFADQWYLKAANIVPVWDEYSGKGVTVGILDDGITNHADLNVNIDTDLIKRGYVDESSQPFLNTGGDAGSHGTFLAGIIAGLRNDQGIVGVAYDAMVKAYVTYGDKSFERQLEVDIYNNSWMYIAGSDPTMYSGEAFGHITNELVSVVQNGRAGLGGVVVASAGNLRVSGENTNYFELMNSRYSITVGGADSLGQYLPFSTAGANVHVVAPGSDITSTDIEGPGGYSNDPDGKTAYGSDYFNSQGNSFATPIVSGVTALMLEANADLGWRDVKEILAYSAVNSDASHTGWRANAATNWNGGGLHYSHDYGFGMVDALAAVRLAESWGKEADISDNEIKVSAQSDVGRVVTNDETGIYSQVEIGSGVEIDQIEVELDMSDTDFSDLQVTLISPDGTGSILIDQPGSKGKNTIKWTLSSGHFIGESGIGVWTLHIVDKKSGDKAVLNSWKLNLYGGEPSDDDVYVYTNEYGRFIEEAYETRGVLNDKEGTDTINAAAVTTDTSINLQTGEDSIIAGRKLEIGEGSVIEHVYTGDGDDRLVGNDVDNRLNAGRGDDVLAGMAGADILDGGEGEDIADYTDSDAAVVINLNESEASGGHAAGDVLVDIEGVIGSKHDDHIIGDDLDNMLVGGEGNDNISGDAGDDDIIGGDGDDTLAGGAGSDTIFVGEGNDSADGGAGVDTVVFNDLRSEYTISGNTVTHNSKGHSNTLSNVEILRFSDGDVAFGGNNTPTISATPTLNMAEDESTTITVASLLGNVSDADGDRLVFSGVGKAKNGVVKLDAEGNITFTPDEDFTGNASFEYTVSDGRSGVATGSVNVVVAASNDAPVATDSVLRAPKQEVVGAITGRLTAEDIDGDDLTFALDANNNTNNGVVVVNTDGSYSYTPNAGFAGVDEFGFVVTDAVGATHKASVSVEITGTPKYEETFRLNAIERFVENNHLDNVVKPTVTSLVTGGFIAAWTSPADGDGFGVYARRFDAGGNPAGDEFLVNTTTKDDQEAPHIVAMHDGGFIVTWQSWGQDGSLEGIYAQRYDANGNEVSEETLINSTVHSRQVAPTTVGLEDGSFVVVWQSFKQDGDHFGIFAKKYNPNGTVAREEFQVNTYTDDRQSVAQIKATPDGGFIVVWESEGQDGDRQGIYAQRFDRFANKIGDEFRVNDGVRSTQVRPDITVLQDGSFVVVWIDPDGEPQPNHRVDITARHFASDGTALTGEFRVNVNDYTNVQQYPTVTTLNDGNYVVVWESHTGTYNQINGEWAEGSLGKIHAQIYDRYSKPIGDMMVVESFDKSYDWRPEVTALEQGGFVVVWQNSDGGADNMYAKIFGTDITSTFAPQYLVGSQGGDVLIAGDADDSVYGGAGDDVMDGGAGVDTATYWRTRDQYEIKQNGDGTWTITAKDAGAEGSDILRNIEHVQFADQLLTIGSERAANGDVLQLNEDNALIIDAGVTADITTSDASNGTVVINDDNTVTYVPNKNYNGADSFVVTAGNDNKTVNVNVVSVNDAPILSVDTAETGVNAAVDINVINGSSDVDGSEFTISQVGIAQNGTAEIINGIIRYTPNVDFRGFDVFEYIIADANGAKTSQTITIDVGKASLQPDLTDITIVPGQDFSYSLATNSFAAVFAQVYPNGDSANLVYSTTLSDGSNLPDWLTFNSNNKTFNGKVDPEDYASLAIVITASDGIRKLTSNVIISADVIAGDVGKDKLDGDSGNNFIYGMSGNDKLFGHDGDDTLIGGLGHDNLHGGDGNDKILGGFGLDVLRGGSGDDYIDGGNNTDEVNYDDMSSGVGINLNLGYAIGNHIGKDEIRNVENVIGTNYDDYIVGNDQDNVLFGRHGDDVIKGGDGNDTLFSDVGEDQLYGGNGNDVLQASEGAEYLDGGEDRDAVDYSHKFNVEGVHVNLATGRGYSGAAKDDVYLNIENVSGSSGSDVLIGDANNNVLFGHDGNDILYGNGGNDSLRGGGGGYDRLIGGAGADSYVIPNDPEGITEILDFTLGTDKIDFSETDIHSNTGEMFLFEQNGNTLIAFSNKYHVGILNILPSQLSFDDFIFNNKSNITNIKVADNTVTSSIPNEGNEENNKWTGHVTNDLFYGNGGDDILVGVGGNDRLYGGSGKDTLQGNTGADYLDGGGGSEDTSEYINSYAGINVNLFENTASGGEAEGDTLVNIEYVVGSNFNDVITGDNADNVLRGADGNDVLRSVGGVDSLEGGSGADRFVIDVINGGITRIADFDINNSDEKIDLTAFGPIDKIKIASAGNDTTININGQYINLVGINVHSLDAFEDGSQFILAENADPLIIIQKQLYDVDKTRYGTNQSEIVSGTGSTAEFFVDGKGSDNIYLNTQGIYTDLWRVSRNSGDVDNVYNYYSMSGTRSTIYQYSTYTTTYTLGPVILDATANKKIDLSEFANIRNLDDLLSVTSVSNGNTYFDLGGGQRVVLNGYEHGTSKNTTEVLDGLTTAELAAMGIAINAPADLIWTPTRTEVFSYNLVESNFTFYTGTLNGTNANDNLEGGYGVDEINAYGGDDIIDAKGDNDVVNSGAGNDTVYGGTGDDEINASSGNDIINGDGNNDTINAGSGDDVLNDGTGSDTMTGSKGADRFNITKDANTTDTITDFEFWNPNEKIDLSEFNSQFANFAQLKNAISQSGENTHINLGNGQTLILENVDHTMLRKENFIGNVAGNTNPQSVRSIDRQVIKAEEFLDLQIANNTFTDVDGDRLGYSATLADGSALPKWLVFDEQNLMLQGTPSAHETGTFSVKVTAHDGSGSVASTFDVQVDAILNATGIDQDITYTEDQNYNVDGIQVTASAVNVTVTLSLSDINAGAFNTATVNSVTSTFNNGVWSASGNVNDVNALLAELVFTPAENYHNDFTIMTNISDGQLPDVTGVMSITGTPTNDAPPPVTPEDDSPIDDPAPPPVIPEDETPDDDIPPDTEIPADIPSVDDISLQFSSSNDNYAVANSFSGFNTNAFTMEITFTNESLFYNSILEYGRNDFVLTVSKYFGLVVWIDNWSHYTDVNVMDGQKHEITISWESSSGSLKVYDNDQLKHSATFAQGANIMHNGQFLISKDPYDIVEGMRGDVESLRIWHEVLDEDEITSNTHSTAPVVDFDFAEGEGGKTYDSVSNISMDIVGGTKWAIDGELITDDIVIMGKDIYGTSGQSDLIKGTAGNDTLHYNSDEEWQESFYALNMGSPDAIVENGETVYIHPRNRSYDAFDGGRGHDIIQLTDEGDVLALYDGNGSTPLGEGKTTARIIDIEEVHAGFGDDVVDFTSFDFSYGDVRILGEDGNDVLWSSAGNDVIEGGAGDDNIDGGSGNDNISGGLGADDIWTSLGQDSIDYSLLEESTSSNRDVIHDYDKNNDTLNFEQLANQGIINTDDLTITHEGDNTIVSANDNDFEVELLGLFTKDDIDFNFG